MCIQKPLLDGLTVIDVVECLQLCLRICRRAVLILLFDQLILQQLILARRFGRQVNKRFLSVVLLDGCVGLHDIILFLLGVWADPLDPVIRGFWSLLRRRC